VNSVDGEHLLIGVAVIGAQPTIHCSDPYRWQSTSSAHTGEALFLAAG